MTMTGVDNNNPLPAKNEYGDCRGQLTLNDAHNHVSNGNGPRRLHPKGCVCLEQQQRDSRDRSHKRLCHHRQDCKMESPAWRTTASNHLFKKTRRAPLVAAQRKKWWLISSTAPAPPSTPTRSLSPYYMKNNISLPTNNNRLGYKAGEQEQRPQPIIMR